MKYLTCTFLSALVILALSVSGASDDLIQNEEFFAKVAKVVESLGGPTVGPTDYSIVRRQHYITMGWSLVVKFRGGEITVTEPECVPVRYKSEEFHPETFSHSEIIDGKRHRTDLDELEKKLVTVTFSEAQIAAENVAISVVGEEVFSEMTKERGELLRGGNFFYYTFNWIQIFQHDGLEVGSRSVFMNVNPSNGRVFEFLYASVIPDLDGTIDHQTAEEVAKNNVMAEMGHTDCVVGKVLLRRGHDEEKGWQRYWVVNLQCDNTGTGYSFGPVIRINAVSGEVLAQPR